MNSSTILVCLALAIFMVAAGASQVHPRGARWGNLDNGGKTLHGGGHRNNNKKFHKEEPKTTVVDVGQFLLGFGEGLEYDFSENITECVQQQSAELNDFLVAWQTLKQGFEYRSVHQILLGLNRKRC